MEQIDPALAEWSFIKKLLFCFCFIFFSLYIFLNPNEIIPYSFYLQELCAQPCNNLISWLAKDVFHIVSPSIKFYNGTVDTVFGYVTVLFIFFAAIGGAVIWMIIGRKKTNFHRLYRLLIVVLRYYLAITWIAYGSLKIIQRQFPSLSPGALLQTYGNSTPKDLAWAFMGYSSAYNYFIGFAEYAVGFLLFFRRTSALGNFIGIGILANVVVFNYTFDVNVKLLTTVLMLMTLFLLSKDIKRLSNVFFFNKTVNPSDNTPFRFKKRWKNVALQLLKYGFIIYLVFFDLRGDMARAKQAGGGPVKPPLYGIYEVTGFIRNKDTIAPLTTDTTRWSKLIVVAPQGNANVMLMNDSLENFALKLDTIKNKMDMYDKTNPSDRYTFSYNRPGNNVLMLSGIWRRDSLKIKLKQVDLSKFPLINRRFRWIIDRNFNNTK